MSGTGDWAAPSPGPAHGPIGSAGAAPPPPAARSGSVGGVEAPLLPPPGYRPGLIPLRPLGVGEILDGAFAAVRRDPGPMLLLSALLAGIGAGVAAVLTLTTLPTTSDAGPNSAALALATAYSGTFTSGAIAARVLVEVVTGLLTGMVVVILSDAVIGRPVTLASVWQRVRPRFWTLLGVSAISGVVLTLASFLFLPWIFLGVVWAFASAVVVLEGRGVRAAFRRSWQLAIGAFWRVLGVQILSGIIVAVVTMLLSLPFLIASGTVAVGHLSSTGSVGTWATVLFTVGQVVAATVTAPIAAGITALLYIDRRIRAEALDISLAAAARADASVAQQFGAA